MYAVSFAMSSIMAPKLRADETQQHTSPRSMNETSQSRYGDVFVSFTSTVASAYPTGTVIVQIGS